MNIKVIQEICGHSRSEVTLDIYTTVTKELKQREFGNFEERMKQQKQEWIQDKFMEKKGCDPFFFHIENWLYE